jgi:hypothetical protein
MPEVKAAYREQVRRLAADFFTPERLGKDLEAVERLVKEPIAREANAARARREGGGFGQGMGMFGGVPLKSFIERRAASVADQLAGKKPGYVPAMMAFGPGGGFGGNPIGQLARPLLDALDANKDGRVTEAEFTAGMKNHFLEWDKDKNGTLDPRELSEGLQKLMPPRPVGRPMGP